MYFCENQKFACYAHYLRNDNDLIFAVFSHSRIGSASNRKQMTARNNQPINTTNNEYTMMKKRNRGTRFITHTFSNKDVFDDEVCERDSI